MRPHLGCDNPGGPPNQGYVHDNVSRVLNTLDVLPLPRLLGRRADSLCRHG